MAPPVFTRTGSLGGSGPSNQSSILAGLPCRMIFISSRGSTTARRMVDLHYWDTSSFTWDNGEMES